MNFLIFHRYFFRIDSIYLRLYKSVGTVDLIRRWSKTVSKNQHQIKNNKYLKIFGSALHRRELWNLNRNSVSKGVAIGLFWAFIPIPFQMVFSTLFALYLGGNVAIALSMVWITNPVTMPILFYICYKIGAFLLQREELPFSFELSFNWLMTQLDGIALPLFLGSFVTALTLSIIGYFTIQSLWFYSTKRDVLKKNKKFKIFD